MSNNVTLIEKIKDSRCKNLQKDKVDEALLISSVLIHLQKVMNVRQGSVAMLSDYGLPDFNDLVVKFPYAIIEIKNGIRACISKYEPRLSNVRVTYIHDDEDPLNLRFDITARLESECGDSKIWFETVLDATGRILIKKF